MLDSKLIILALVAGILFKVYDEIVDVKEIQDLVDPATTELIKAFIIGIVTVFSIHDISFVIMMAIASTAFYLSDIYAYTNQCQKTTGRSTIPSGIQALSTSFSCSS
jgi:hypothetical protein